jgi:transposase-like protein
MEPEMPRTRRDFSPAQKVNILREHFIERLPISDLCEKHQIQPTLFYQWQKTFFERGTAAFESERAPSGEVANKDRKLQALENKLTLRNEALSELMEEHVRLKKSLGED